MARLNVLSIAVASGRIGYVFFQRGELCDWGMVRKAAKQPKLAAQQTHKWFTKMQPDVVITEDVSASSRKGDNSKDIIETITNVTADLPLMDISVKRVQRFPNKYEEAKALAEQFPDILPWMPKKPRLWESEPRNTVYFEALAMAVQVGQVPVHRS